MTTLDQFYVIFTSEQLKLHDISVNAVFFIHRKDLFDFLYLASFIFRHKSVFYIHVNLCGSGDLFIVKGTVSGVQSDPPSKDSIA